MIEQERIAVLFKAYIYKAGMTLEQAIDELSFVFDCSEDLIKKKLNCEPAYLLHKRWELPMSYIIDDYLNRRELTDKS